MEIQTKTSKNNVILNIYGDIDQYSSNVLKDILTSKMIQKDLNITVNLADVNFVDSRAITVLLNYSEEIEKQQGHLKVINLSRALIKDFTFFESIKD